MRNQDLDEREQRRIATRRERYGADFDSRNARHAASFAKTKFNSRTGSEAAKKRWAKHRADKLKKSKENN